MGGGDGYDTTSSSVLVTGDGDSDHEMSGEPEVMSYAMEVALRRAEGEFNTHRKAFERASERQARHEMSVQDSQSRIARNRLRVAQAVERDAAAYLESRAAYLDQQAERPGGDSGVVLADPPALVRYRLRQTPEYKQKRQAYEGESDMPWYGYGNFIGPYWSDGRRQESVAVATVSPVDEYDATGEAHDIAYGRGDDLGYADLKFALANIGRRVPGSIRYTVHRNLAALGVGAQGIRRFLVGKRFRTDEEESTRKRQRFDLAYDPFVLQNSEENDSTSMVVASGGGTKRALVDVLDRDAKRPAVASAEDPSAGRDSSMAGPYHDSSMDGAKYGDTSMNGYSSTNIDRQLVTFGGNQMHLRQIGI